MTVNLGEKIRQLRKGKGISQEVLAQYLGVSFQAVSKWDGNDVTRCNAHSCHRLVFWRVHRRTV